MAFNGTAEVWNLAFAAGLTAEELKPGGPALAPTEPPAAEEHERALCLRHAALALAGDGEGVDRLDRLLRVEEYAGVALDRLDREYAVATLYEQQYAIQNHR